MPQITERVPDKPGIPGHSPSWLNGGSHKKDKWYTTQPIRDWSKINRMLDFLRTADYQERGRRNSAAWWLELWIVMQLHTGLRLSEQLRLRWKDVMKGEEVLDHLIVVPLKQRTETKRKRVIPIVPELRRTILKFHNGQGPAEFLFINRKSRKPLNKRTINAALKRVFTEFDIATGEDQNPSSHTLRKTFALRYYQNTSLIATMHMLGHKKQDTTLAYLGITGEQLKKGYRMINYDASLINKLSSEEILIEPIIDFCLHSANFTLGRLRRDLRSHLERFTDNEVEIETGMNWIEEKFLQSLGR